MTRRDLAVVRLVLGAFAWVGLAIAIGFEPAQIAAGEHLSWTGYVPPGCPGCPMCGLSRGFAHGVRGQLAEALALNPVFPLYFAAALGIAAQAPAALFELLRRGPAVLPRRSRRSEP